MKIIPSNVPTVQDFYSALQRGEQAIREAAELLCKMVDADPKCYQKINKELGIDFNVLANLERVGRGAMHYKLLFDSSPASKFLISMPQSQQAEAYEKGVAVVVVADGKTVVETKKPQELTPAQAKQVFANKHILSVDEQIKATKQAAIPVRVKAKPQAAQRYEFSGGKIVILAMSAFTMSQFESILDEWKQREIKSLASKK